jgi:hypothetical protein
MLSCAERQPLEKASIPYVLVGRHRHIRAEDLFAYKRDRDSRRRQALSEVTENDTGLL